MKTLVIAIVIIVALAVTVAYLAHNSKSTGNDTSNSIDQEKVIIREQVDENLATATFAGGCFWCTEAALQELNGVEAAISGYAGGEEYNPTYEQVYKETTGHREAVRVYFDPESITYEEILEAYWQSIDPTDPEGQFADKGRSYTTAIYYENDEQKVEAEESKNELENSGRFEKPIVTEILPFATFYEAEEYHQDFYKKSAQRYETYKDLSGREEYKEKVWSEIQKEQ